jgi:hypothetical protein
MPPARRTSARTRSGREGGRAERPAIVLARWAAALVVATTAADACRSPSEEARYAPVARLLDGLEVARDGPLRGGDHAELDDERRPVHSSARIAAATVVCAGGAAAAETDPDAPCQARAESDGREAPWAIFQASRVEGREQAGTRSVADGGAGEPWSEVLALEEARGRGWSLPRQRADRLTYALVPSLESRDFESRLVEIPPGARLRFAIGTEELAWGVDAAPVEFAVRALGDEGTSEVYRHRLDPSHRSGDRGWREADVPLDGLAGKRVRFAFEVRAVAPLDRRPQLPLWADPRVIAPAPEGPARPSVVLVSLDTLRARSMSAYGHDRETTPEFARLAREGTLFERAFTTFSNTLGAHMSMLTGLYPAAHGTKTTSLLGTPQPTLAERLRGAGYETAAVTENGMISARWGFARGFARYVEDKTSAWRPVGARRTFDRALACAEAHADEPFFLFVHTYAVHAACSRRALRRGRIGSATSARSASSTTTSPVSSPGSTACSSPTGTSSS